MYIPPFKYTRILTIYSMGRKDTSPALITNRAHAIIVRESTRRKLTKMFSPEEYSYKYLISEAVISIYKRKRVNKGEND